MHTRVMRAFEGSKEAFRYGVLFALAGATVETQVADDPLSDGDLKILTKATSFLREGVAVAEKISRQDYQGLTVRALTASNALEEIATLRQEPPIPDGTEIMRRIVGIADALESALTAKTLKGVNETTLIAARQVFYDLGFITHWRGPLPARIDAN